MKAVVHRMVVRDGSRAPSLASEIGTPYRWRTAMRTAVKLQITIPRHRRIQLPANVPEGKAEVILLYPDIATSSEDVSTAAPASTASGERRPGKARAAALRPGPSARCPIDYFARLRARQPDPLSAEAARALDEADRGER